MSKSFKVGSTAKLAAEREIRTQQAMRSASYHGCDPRNSHAMQAALFMRGFPPTKIVDGKRVWDLTV